MQVLPIPFKETGRAYTVALYPYHINAVVVSFFTCIFVEILFRRCIHVTEMLLIWLKTINQSIIQSNKQSFIVVL